MGSYESRGEAKETLDPPDLLLFKRGWGEFGDLNYGETMRRLFLIAYDITDNKRLSRVRHCLKGYSTGGQKSVYECFLSEGEKQEIVSKISLLIEPDEDRVHIFTMDGRSRTHTLGIALQPKDPSFFYFG